MKIRWSAWVPWLRRKHPLGEPVRPFRVTGYPDVPRVVGTAGQDQGKPDVPLVVPGEGYLRAISMLLGPETAGGGRGSHCSNCPPCDAHCIPPVPPFGPVERESRP